MLTNDDFKVGDWVCRRWVGGKDVDIFQIKEFLGTGDQYNLTHTDNVYYRNGKLLKGLHNGVIMGINTDKRVVDTSATYEEMPEELKPILFDINKMVDSLDEHILKKEQRENNINSLNNNGI